MIVLTLFSWWYGRGWGSLAKKVGERTNNVLDFFSVGTLAATMFAPFRQISSEQVQGAPGIQMRAFFDRLFSRFFGAFLRGSMIIFGLFLALLSVVFGAFQLVLWPVVPLLPVAGLIVMGTSWLPL